MPEISEQDFAALAAQVASLSSALAVARRRIDDLEEGMTDHLGLDWGESLVDVNSPHPNISANTIESGGGTIRQDENGMQVASGGTSLVAVHFVDAFSLSPGTNRPRSELYGDIISASDYATIALQAVGPLAPSNYSSNVGVTADSSKAQVGLNAANTNGDSSSVGAYNTTTRVSVLLQGALELQNSTISPSQITSNQNDYSPTNLFKSSILRLSTDASRDITGITGGLDGRLLFVFNVGSFDIVLKDEDAGSTAANRFALQADITIPPDGAALLLYDATSSRWRCVGTY